MKNIYEAFWKTKSIDEKKKKEKRKNTKKLFKLNRNLYNDIKFKKILIQKVFI